MDTRFEKYDIIQKDGCLATAIEEYPPYTMFRNNTFVGSCVTIYSIIMKQLGFCYKFIRPPDGSFGVMKANGSWTGLIGLIQRKEAEVITCPMAKAYSRFQVIDFSHSILSTDIRIAYPRPLIGPNLLGFIMPFSIKVWFAILGVCLFVTLVTFFGKKWISFERSETDVRHQNLNLSLAWAFEGILNQRMNIMPTSAGGQTLVTLWLLICLILGVIYKGNLSAILIVPKIIVPFDSLKELLSQNLYRWSFLQGSIVALSLEESYKKNPNSDMGKGWSRKAELYIYAGNITSYILDKKLACIDVGGTITSMLSDDFSKTGKCRFAVAREPLTSLDNNFAFKKKSAMQAWMNRVILHLREGGILSKILGQETANATYCNVPPGSELKPTLRPLVVEDFLGMIYLLLGGWILGTVVFFGELLINALMNPPTKRVP